MDICSIFDKLVAPLRRRVRLMVSRAILSAISDGSGIQLVQVKLLDSEVRDGVEHFQNYGYSSVPHPGAEGVMVCVSGDRDHGIVINMDDRRYRIKGLQNGEVALYTDEDINTDKHHIIFKRGNKIELRGKDIDLKATGTLRLEGDAVQVHAHAYYRFDCNGQGQKWDGLGVETWQDDDVARPHHNHSPPEIS